MSQSLNRLMVMAGGTGGHVFPALAVAEALQNRNTQVTWLGTRKGLEATVVPANDIDIEWITIEGLRGKGFISWLIAPVKLIRAMWQSVVAIRKVKPDCVLGMGGFVAGPGGLVARLMGKPLVVHEQNAVAGLTNKYLAKIASKVLTGFPDVKGFGKNATWVGNPVRPSITASDGTSAADEGINILVIGGSQGALSFNQHLPSLFAKIKSSINVWHQTGRAKSQEVTDTYRKIGLPAKVTEFIDDMAEAYKWADLLVCRAGAMTIAECCAAAKPTLLIPYPHSAGDHQFINAQALSSIGAGVILSNHELSSSHAVAVLEELLSDKAKLIEMGEKAATLHKPDALDQVVKICEEVMNA